MNKTQNGIVVSDAMEKTIVVSVEYYKVHPRYGKRMRRAKKYYAHDPKNVAKVGDKVEIQETRPMSKTKRWKLIKVNK